MWVGKDENEYFRYSEDMISIRALKFEINDGERNRPIFLGSLGANELSRISAVPSFGNGTTQKQIADNILNSPVKDWQRPLDPVKVEKIRRRFNEVGQFMPNPVLLAVAIRESVSVVPEVIGDQSTGIWKIQVEDDGQSRPLWILDGQHRVRGMAETDRNNNPLPFVLLHSEELNVFTEENFANIFAEVSTKATSLTDLHKEWLEYAFKLRNYEPSEPNSVSRSNSMKTAAILCSEVNFLSGLQNPYTDKILFNPNNEDELQPVCGNGFKFTALELKDWIYAEYYNRPSEDGQLNPLELAEQIASATVALSNKIGMPARETVFFGDNEHRHSYMERAFICAVLHRLVFNKETDWNELLDQLKFPQTDWDFTGWVVTTSGTSGTISKKISRNVLCDAFRIGELPNGSPNLVDFLQGGQASVSLVAKFLDEHGEPLDGNEKVVTA